MTKIISNDHKAQHKKVSESITLRFEKAILDELRDESEQNMESVNTLLNQIVKSYIKWHKPSKIAGLVYINRFLYKDIVEHLPDQTVSEITDKYARHYFMDTIAMFDGDESVSFYIHYLLAWLRISGFNSKIDEDNREYVTIKIQLDLGLKFSKYISAKIKSILETLKQTEVKVEFTDHIVIVQISRLRS
jgi:hypothetical protein